MRAADQARKAEEFRALHVPGKQLILFNIWDVGSAKAVAASGATAIATSRNFRAGVFSHIPCSLEGSWNTNPAEISRSLRPRDRPW